MSTLAYITFQQVDSLCPLFVVHYLPSTAEYHSMFIISQCHIAHPPWELLTSESVIAKNILRETCLIQYEVFTLCYVSESASLNLHLSTAPNSVML